jgi:hypothetical protein
VNSRAADKSVCVRVAVFSDVHGNVIALYAVLRAAKDKGIDTFWCMGDLVAHGPRPVEVVARLRQMSHLVCVRGNADRYVMTGDMTGMIPPIDRPTSPEEFRVLGDAREPFAWTRGCLVGSGHGEWLAGSRWSAGRRSGRESRPAGPCITRERRRARSASRTERRRTRSRWLHR